MFCLYLSTSKGFYLNNCKYVYKNVCVYVRVKNRTHKHTHTHNTYHVCLSWSTSKETSHADIRTRLEKKQCLINKSPHVNR
jgi:hypothetical protein